MLVIDQLARAAERQPLAPLGAGHRLSNAEAWARSGAVASWLIAQGFGPGGRSLSILAGDSAERALLLLGALRAGALVCLDEAEALTFISKDGRLTTTDGIAFAALARCSIDASVAERRLHIDTKTPARLLGDVCQRQGDLATVADAVAAEG